MAVRQLAGPIPLVGIDGVTPLPAANTDLRKAMWLPNFGLIVAASTMIPGGLNQVVCSVALDGRVCPIQRENTINAVWFFDATTGQFRSNRNAQDYNHEPIALSSYAVTTGFYLGGGQNAGVDFADRRVRGLSTPYVQSSLKNSRAYLPDCPISAGFPIETMVAGRSQNEVLAACNGGSYPSDFLFRMYDASARVWNTNVMHLGTPAVSLVCATELGVLISFHGNGGTVPFYMNVWSFDVVPTALSPVSLQQATSAASSQVAVYRVQVLGAQGEGVMGERVSWALSGPGTLLDSLTVSDVNGWATCRVLQSIAASGTLNVTASVTC